EVLRVFAQADRDVVARMIRELLQFDVPCVGVFDDIILVQRTDLSPEQEVLVLLHYAGEPGFTRSELGRYARCAAPRVTEAVQRLRAPDRREIVSPAGSRFRLTDLGSRRVREELPDKLLVA